MSYTFVKIGRINSTEDGKDTCIWFFKPNKFEQIIEHWEKYPSAVIHEGAKTIVDRTRSDIRGHSTNHFVLAVETLNNVTCGNIIMDMVQIENAAYNNRINDYINGREIYLTTDMTVYMMDERFFEIKETVVKDTLTFPHEEKPSLEDVNYIMWEGGQHYYAKIGKLDVLDKNGNQKWNTKEEAIEAAKWYIEKYWQ